MDVQRYIEALEKGDAPNAIVPLIIAEARVEASEGLRNSPDYKQYFALKKRFGGTTDG